MPDGDILGNLEGQHQQGLNAWEPFHKAVINWNALSDREAPVELPDDVTEGMEPIDLQSTDIETDLETHVSALLRNPTYFDIALLSSPTEENKAKARKVLLVTTNWWLQYNEQRCWDEGCGEGQSRWGAYISRQLTKPWEEPDTSQYEGDGKMRKREEAMKKMRFMPFFHSEVMPGSYCALEKGREATACFYEAEIPCIDAWGEFTSDRQVRGKDGTFGRKKKARPTLKNGRLDWVGEDDEPDESLWQQKMKLLVRDAEDPKGTMCPIPGCNHVRRIITEYLYGYGQSVKEAECVNEYASPYRYSSFVVVPCFRSVRREPLKRYRPLMLGEYDKIARRNYYDTTIVTMARNDYGDGALYLEATKVPEYQASAWNEFSEGGAKHSVDAFEAGSGKMPIYYGLQRVPREISPHLMALREANEAELREVKPNAYVTGNPFMESSKTATEVTTSGQTAQLPYSRMLTQSDAARKRIVSDWFHAIRFWAVVDKPDTEVRYYAAASGEENALSDGFKPGESAWISASMLDSFEFDIVLKTESETIQEEVARWNLAKDKWHEGVLTPEELIRAAGERDVERKKQELKVAQIRAELDPDLRPLRLEYVKRRLEVRSGLQFGMVGAPGMPGAAGAAPGTAGQNGATPSRGMSQQEISGAFMTPALIDGPEGTAMPAIEPVV